MEDIKIRREENNGYYKYNCQLQAAIFQSRVSQSREKSGDIILIQNNPNVINATGLRFCSDITISVLFIPAEVLKVISWTSWSFISIY